MGIYLEWARPWPAPERERGAEFQGRRDATPLRNVDWVRILEMEVFGYMVGVTGAKLPFLFKIMTMRHHLI